MNVSPRWAIKLLLLGSALMLMPACSTYLNIRTMQPGPVNLGTVTTLDVLHSTGRRSARETVISTLISMSRAQGHFKVSDVTEKGIEVKIAGRMVTLSDGTMVPKGTAGMRIDVIEWQGGTDVVQQTRRNEKGQTVKVNVPVRTGQTLLGVTIFTASGKAILAEKEYEGNSQLPRDQSKDAAIDAACKIAVNKILADITPTPVTVRVKLDTADKGQKDIIKSAEAGNLNQATKDLEVYLKANAGNARAQYNLAVFYDAMGRYDEAIKLYDSAIKGNAKAEWYSDARKQCTRRMAAASALSED